MSLLSETLTVSRFSLASLPARAGSAVVVAVGMAIVAAVLVSVLSISSGLIRGMRAGSHPDNAIVVSSEYQTGGTLSREDCVTIAEAPGIALGPDNHPLVDCEFTLGLPGPEGFAEGVFMVRGVGPTGLALAPRFAVVAGRTFRPGLRELIVGVGAQRIFHVNVGDTVILPDGEWPVVGVFSSDGGLLESGLLADANTLMTSSRRDAYGSVLVRLTGSAAFASFSRWLTTHPSLKVVVDREAQFRLRSAGAYVDFFSSIAYFVASILAVGALFGSVNILYSAVSSRAREIATLRAVGYRAIPVAVAVVVEAMLLAFVGALVGGSGAWLVFNDRDGLVVAEVYQQAVTPALIATGIGWALVIAILGAIPPAIRAARLPVAEAMRAI